MHQAFDQSKGFEEGWEWVSLAFGNIQQRLPQYSFSGVQDGGFPRECNASLCETYWQPLSAYA
jgi:hypothetical protein